MSNELIRSTRPAHGDLPHDTWKKILQKLQDGVEASWNHADMLHVLGHVSDQLPHDAFYRFRVSEPTTLFDSAIDVADRTDLWASTGAYVHNAARSTCTLSVPAAATYSARQTKRVFHYQPGKSQLGIFTFTFGLRATGITRRVGLFNDGNGLFLEQTSTGLRFVVRSNTAGIVVDTQYDQGIWNMNPMNGTGEVPATLDESKAHIFFVQFEWLGVGAIEFGFFQNGRPVICHRVSNTNELYGVYMATANLPVRYEITNDGTGPAADMQQICSTVISEGGVSLNGPLHAVDRGATPLITLNDAALYPLLALRLGPTAYELRGNIYVNNLTVFCPSTAEYRWALLLNPAVAGVALTFAAAGTIAEAATGALNTSKVTGGTLIASGYGASTTQSTILSERALPDDALLGCDLAGVRDVLVLAVQRITGTTESFYGSINFREQV